MNWTLSCPDGIGDFLLRLPWLFEMERRGWHLQLLAREPTLEAARLVGLTGSLLPLTCSPYSKKTRRLRDPFAKEIQAISRHHPDLLFFGPSQPSFLEEQLVEANLPMRLGGFVLKEDFWPSESILPAQVLSSAYDLQVEVRNTDSESMRNQKAANMLLEENLCLPSFRMERCPAFAHRSDLPDKFLVVSPGYREGDYFLGLGVEKWVRELRELEAQTSLDFVFTGSSSEAKANAGILAGLREPDRHQNWTGQLASLSELAGFLESSKGYVGKDSGTMHLAAALGKPIVAVFGGGHWKRFLPTGTRAAVLTVEVPCRGCDWRCHLPEPVCVREIPAGSVAAAWRQVISLDQDERLVLAFSPGEAAMKVLSVNPQVNFPARKHEERRSKIKALREEAIKPWWQRIIPSRR